MPVVPISVQQQRLEQQVDSAAPDQSRLSASTTKLVKRLGLKYISTAELTIRRQRHGRGFGYCKPDGAAVTAAEKRRLAALAVPPAYQDVLYAADPCAHIQAIGRDAAGRLQYRYHAQWQRVREVRKARRLAVARVYPFGRDRPGRTQCHSSRQRKLCAAARHARRGNAAQIQRLGVW